MKIQTSPNKSNLNPEGAIAQLPFSIILCILWKIEKGIYPEKIKMRVINKNFRNRDRVMSHVINCHIC